MTTAVGTLADFLLARIAEDEALADSLGHIPQWGSRRSLAECDAKRRIVEAHDCAHECPQDGDTCGWWRDNQACDVLRLLALPYADHKDYRPEWRP